VRPAHNEPNAAIRSAEGSTPMLGFVLRDMSSPFFSLVAHAAQQRADAAGYGLLFTSSSNRRDREEEQLRRFLALGVRGLIIVSMKRTYRITEPVRELHEAGFPFVMVSYTEEEDVPFIGADLDRCGELATEHLIAHGRKRIGYVIDKFGSALGELRGRGYRRAMERHGLAIDPAFQFQYPLEGEWNDYESGYAIGEHIAGLARRPDAMFAFNDLGALGLEDGLLEHGVRVPDDVAVVGMDDIEMAARARVPLTTVRQPTDRIGALAVETLLARLRGEKPATRQLLAPELIVRASCGAMPNDGDAQKPTRGRAARAAARIALAADRNA
jgi:DNA-binding LacI/PurR family transcriptional regulator